MSPIDIDVELDGVRIVDAKIPGTDFAEPIAAPTHWRDSDVAIIAQKYLHPQDGGNLFAMIDRVVGRIEKAGLEAGLFATGTESEIFREALGQQVIDQKFTWNSPVWFNVDINDPPQCWACLILNVEDSMHGDDGIMAWWTTEAETFLGGSGSGVNLSKLRASGEPLRSGYAGHKGTSSGPVSFMRTADAVAGSIRSGGRTRRAAKMVILDIDHPDIMEFIRTKADAEYMARTLQAEGFAISLNGDDSAFVPFQNANNSVRVTDDFMERATNPAIESLWELKDRLGLRPDARTKAPDLWNEIAEAAWACGDPGVQFHDTINAWHTTPAEGEIRGSNPCSEYMSVDDTVCNLGSINLLKFWTAEDGFDLAALGKTVRLAIQSMDLIVDMSSYPSERIAANVREMRQLGLGYTNLGALLMTMGVPYDSDEGRAIAGAVQYYIQACATAASTGLAEVRGPYARWERNKDAHLEVLRRHRNAFLDEQFRHTFDSAAPIWRMGEETWREALERAEEHGMRNAQLTAIAPTGTISFMLGAETTGIEPVIAIDATKDLVGGGTADISAKECVKWGFRQLLGRKGIVMEGSEAVLAEDVSLSWRTHPIFQTALGDNALSPEAHIAMMAAVQPSVSGGISKTVNMPADATVQDVADIYELAWTSGLKSLAIYRDGSKAFQPVKAKVAAPEQQMNGRTRMPGTRPAVTHKFQIGETDFYLTAGFYDDGTLGEIFLKASQEGSFVSGMIDSFATAVSIGLQYGVPLDVFARKFVHRTFEPNGMVIADSDIATCRSIVDYVFRWLSTDEARDERRTITLEDTAQREDIAEAVPIGVALEDGGAGATIRVAIDDSAGAGAIVHAAGDTSNDPWGQCPECSRFTLEWTGNCRRCTTCGFDEGCG